MEEGIIRLNILSIKEKIDYANGEAVEKLMNSDPLLTGVELAFRSIPNLGAKTILHAGPPIEWDRMCGALKGAIIGSILFEQWADNVEEAESSLHPVESNLTLVIIALQ